MMTGDCWGCESRKPRIYTSKGICRAPFPSMSLATTRSVFRMACGDRFLRWDAKMQLLRVIKSSNSVTFAFAWLSQRVSRVNTAHCSLKLRFDEPLISFFVNAHWTLSMAGLSHRLKMEQTQKYLRMVVMGIFNRFSLPQMFCEPQPQHILEYLRALV